MVNLDGIVNILDLVMVRAAFGSRQGDLNWNEAADLAKDGGINIVDLTIVAINFVEAV